MRRRMIAGNWKMNGDLAALGELDAIGVAARAAPQIDVAICPPFTLISPAVARADGVMIGAQDCHAQESGPFTGNISAAMLVEAGAVLTIVGHSERRRDQMERNRGVRAKAERAIAHGMSAIICLGENEEEHDAGQTTSVVERRLEASLPIARGEFIMIAYEPLWAIGTGRTPATAAVAEIHALIRRRLRDLLDPAEAERVRILYGGSVNGTNAADLMAIPDVDGVLVGGASLSAEQFLPIIAAAA